MYLNAQKLTILFNFVSAPNPTRVFTASVSPNQAAFMRGVSESYKKCSEYTLIPFKDSTITGIL